METVMSYEKAIILSSIKENLKHKNEWNGYVLQLDNGGEVRLKMYEKYLQVFKINGIRFGGHTFGTQKELLAYATESLNY